MTKQEKIKEALSVIMSRGGVDGEHHKQWVLDQVVRVLTDCPVTVKTKILTSGVPFDYEVLGESKQYKAWLEEYRGAWDDENEEYEFGEWDEGIAP